MAARRPRLSLAPPELALVPLLDMISLLIQVMLFNVQFGAYGAVTTDVATASVGAAEGEPGIAVEITPEGFDVSLDDGTRHAVPCRGGACVEPGAWDVERVRDLVAARKVDPAGAPLDVALVPRPGVPFEVVVHAMDVLGAAPGGRKPLATVALVGGAP